MSCNNNAFVVPRNIVSALWFPWGFPALERIKVFCFPKGVFLGGGGKGSVFRSHGEGLRGCWEKEMNNEEEFMDICY